MSKRKTFHGMFHSIMNSSNYWNFSFEKKNEFNALWGERIESALIYETKTIKQ